MGMELRIKGNCLKLLTWLDFGNSLASSSAKTTNTQWAPQYNEPLTTPNSSNEATSSQASEPTA